MNFKGSLSLLILHILSQQPSHGYRIAQEIKQRSAGVLDFKEGTLYPTLHSLEQKALIASYTTDDSGRARRYYRLTEAGHAVLAQERAEWVRYAQAVTNILGEAT
jgi:transcriptional regulator